MQLTEFKSKSGKLYNLAIAHFGTVRDAKKILGVDVTNIVAASQWLCPTHDASGMGNLDPARLVDLIYLMCREQAKAHGLPDDQGETFGRDFDGDAILEASTALMWAIVEFQPTKPVDPATGMSPRDAARAVCEKALAGWNALVSEGLAMIANGGIDKALDAQFATYAKLRAAAQAVPLN